MRLIDKDALKKEMCGDGCFNQCQSCRFLKVFIKQPTIAQWIPVSERLPEEDREYLVTWMMATKSIGDIRPFIGIWEYEEAWGFDKPDYVNWYDDVRVTAWMELPEVYREKD